MSRGWETAWRGALDQSSVLAEYVLNPPKTSSAASIQKSAHTITVQLDEFPQIECAHITSTQIAEGNIAPEAPSSGPSAHTPNTGNCSSDL